LEVVSTVEDITPPELLHFSFSPVTIDLSTTAQDVNVTMQVADDLTGIQQSGGFCSAIFSSPSGMQYKNISLFDSHRISGDALDGTYQRPISFPQLSETGIWHVIEVQVADLIRNKRYYYEADLIAMGFPTELEVVSAPTIDAILDFFDESVADVTLFGIGPGNSANGRLNALRNMLEMAGDLINIPDIEGACTQLESALGKCDGDPLQPDFVTGSAVSTLYDMIVELMTELGCE